MQKAKIEFIDTSPSLEKTLPYYWAAPILTGKVDILLKKKTEPYFPIIIGIVLVISIIFIVKVTYKKKPAKASDIIFMP